MSKDPVKFSALNRDFRHKPWPAFTAITEWGDIASDLGDGVLEHLLGPDASGVLEMLKSQSGVSAAVIQTLLGYLDSSDLGERVQHYLDVGCVEVGTADGWLPLHGEKAADSALNEGLDGLDLLAAAWHTVREGLRPLSDRLGSTGAATE